MIKVGELYTTKQGSIVQVTSIEKTRVIYVFPNGFSSFLSPKDFTVVYRPLTPLEKAML